METLLIKRLQAFEQLGIIINNFLHDKVDDICTPILKAQFEEIIYKQSVENRWFSVFFIRNALQSIAKMLSPSDLYQLPDRYPQISSTLQSRTIAVISAGNIPLAAFHDFFSVLISGNHYLGKLSHSDRYLLPFLADILISLYPDYEDKIDFVEKITEFDKIIATGSDNSSRYFEYYFGKYPMLLRKNRNSVAILSGNESSQQIHDLCLDICLYYGLGCRSISKIWVPRQYDFTPFLMQLGKESKILEQNNAYLNNLDYQKAILLMNSIPFYDAGPMIVVENDALFSPISVLNFQYYESLDEVMFFLQSDREKIQCVVTQLPISEIHNVVNFGRTQVPSLFDYPDNEDIIKFCID